MLNVFDTIKNELVKAAQQTASDVADDICENIKDRLLAGDHYRTGRLYNSVTNYENPEDGSCDIVAEHYLQYIEGGQLLEDAINDNMQNMNEILSDNIKEAMSQ